MHDILYGRNKSEASYLAAFCKRQKALARQPGSVTNTGRNNLRQLVKKCTADHFLELCLTHSLSLSLSLMLFISVSPSLLRKTVAF